MGMEKRRMKSVLMGCMVAVLVVLGLFSSKPVSVEAGDTDEFTDLSQEEITDAMGAGWNLGNQLEAVSSSGYPLETAWGNPKVTEQLIQTVKEQGFSTIRIPVSYLNYIGDADSGYEIDADWLARVHEVVDYAIDEGLYVVINMHGDGYTTISSGWLFCNASNQTEIKAKYAAVWKQIATEFKDYDEHLIFESMNEEFDGTYNTPNKTYYSNINAYNQIFVDTVRQTGGNNAKRWLIVCGWNTDITYTCGDYGFEIPEDTYLDSSISGPRLMISVHYYTPWNFCGGATQSTYSYTSGGWDDPYENMKTCYTTFVSKGYPVFIGEYGATNQNNESERIAFVTAVCTAARQYGCIPVIWDNNGQGTGTDKFGLINRSTCAVTQQGIIDAIMDVFNSTSIKKYQTVTVSASSVSCSVGGTKTIKSEASTTVTYSSSNTSVATVNATTGKITAKKVGTAVITATAKSTSKYYKATATIKVTVKPAATTISSVKNTSTGVKITWTKVTGATGYYVYRATSKSGTYSKIATITSGSTVTYTNNTGGTYKVSSGKTYYYKVYAYASTGKSSASAVKSIRYLTAGKISSLTNTSSGIKVQWTKVSGASGYYIYRKAGSGDYKKIATVTSASTVTYTNKTSGTYKVSNGTTYTYYILPYYKSSSGTVTKGSHTGTKKTVRLTAVTISSLKNSSSKKLTVKWGKNSKATGYQIQYSTSSSFASAKTKSVTVSGAASVSKTIGSLTKGKKYYVRVRAYKTISGTKYYSAWSGKKSVTVSK